MLGDQGGESGGNPMNRWHPHGDLERRRQKGHKNSATHYHERTVSEILFPYHHPLHCCVPAAVDTETAGQAGYVVVHYFYTPVRLRRVG